MTNTDFDTLKNLPLFHDLSVSQTEKIFSLMQHRQVDVGELLVKQDEYSNEFFIILDGEVEIIKRTKDGTEEEKIATLKKDAVIGEMRLVESKPRSATVKATKPTQLLELNIDELKKTADSVLITQLTANLAKELSNRLRETNEVTVASLQKALEESRARNSMGKFIVTFIVMISLYTFCLSWISHLSRLFASTTVVSLPFISILAIAVFILIKCMDYPISKYGLTLKNWKRSLAESVLITGGLIIAATLFVYGVTNILPQFYPGNILSSVLSFNGLYRGPINLEMFFLMIIGYSIFAPVQEFIVRGALQSSFEMFFTGRYRNWIAIITSNMIFSVMHLYLSFELAITAFILGLFWGWLYARTHTLIGVSVSHIMIGIWAILFVGF